MENLSASNTQRFAFAENTLIRKEHFGVLILLRNGQRYTVPDKYFPLLEKISDGKEIKLNSGKEESFFDGLIAKKIIAPFGLGFGNIKIIENKFISKDCLSFPRTVYWECTRVCNYRCVHCYSMSGRGAKDEMPFERFKEIIKEMGRKGVEFLCIGGGEPLLYSAIYDAIRLALKNGVEVEMTTNASLINDSIIEKLKNAGLKFIQVSIDGATKETYDAIRPGGDFYKVMEVLPALASSFTLSTCTVANKKNLGEIEAIIAKSINAGAKHFRILPLMEFGRGKEVKSLQLSKEELADLHRLVRDKKTSEKRINVQFNENLINPNVKNIEWMPENHYGCSAGRTTCSIDPNGNVYPCSFMEVEELVCGNINKDWLSDIWEKSEIFKKIRNLGHIFGKCAGCSHLKLCRGGCRAAAYMKSQRLDGSDPLCVID